MQVVRVEEAHVRVEEAHVRVLYGPLLMQVVRVEEAHVRVLHRDTCARAPYLYLQHPSTTTPLTY
jgi:hypothetical protein